MSTGSFCQRHQRWNPDGVCPYCEPAPAKVPETSAASAEILRDAALNLVTTGRASVAVDEDGEIRKPEPARPLLPLVEALTKLNPLLVDKPYEATPVSRTVFCACRKWLFDANTPAMEQPDKDGLHTPSQCPERTRFPLPFRDRKPLVKRCACGTVDLDDGRFKEPYTDNIGVHGRTFCDRTPTAPTFMGVPIKVDPSLKPDEFRFTPPRDQPYTRCACNRTVLATGIYAAAARLGGLTFRVLNETHSYARCVIER